MEFGEAKQAQKSRVGRVSTLGLFEADIHDVQFGPWTLGHPYEHNYDEFCSLIAEARESGRNLALEDYADACPVAHAQMTKSGRWGKWKTFKHADVPGFILVKGNDQVPGPTNLHPDKMAIPDKVEKALTALDAKNKKDPRSEPQETIAEYDARCEEEEEAIKKIRDKALEDRAGVTCLKDTSQGVDGRLKTGPRWAGVDAAKTEALVATGNAMPAPHLAKLISGEMCIDGNLKCHNVDRVLRVQQLREIVSKDRDKRFMVGRLRNVDRVLEEGHNVWLGSVVCVEWGEKNHFAVARVVKIVDATDKRDLFSAKVCMCNKKTFRWCRLHHRKDAPSLRLEVLDPVGTTESGSVRYRSTGWCLNSYVAAKLLIKEVHMLKLDSLRTEESEVCVDALLRVEDIVDLENEGWTRITAVDGVLEKLRDAGQVRQVGLGEHECTLCVSKWFDDETGLLVRCTKCSDTYHQDCHGPKIKSEDMDTWMCAACSGADDELCTHCGKGWNMQDEANPAANNALVQCEGGCEKWWHQKCHNPGIFPLPLGRWVCQACEAEELEFGDEDEQGRGNAPSRKRQTKATPKRKRGKKVQAPRVPGTRVVQKRSAAPLEGALANEGSAKLPRLEKARTRVDRATVDRVASSTTKLKRRVFKRKEKVRGNYQGGGTKYRGVVTRVYADAEFYDILYEDGDKDVKLAAKHVSPRVE